MGFPRIISKSNKIYTKLGDFCLSGDGNSFWILCHTCQEELQTQDQFWKHIQDEHNFMHGLVKHEMEVSAPLLPLPLYRKLNEDEQRTATEQEDESQEQHERKDYTDMRPIEMGIKVEPQLSQQAPVAAGHTPHAVELTGAPHATLYAQLPQVPPTVNAYAALVQQHTTAAASAVPPTALGHMSAAAAAVAAAAGPTSGGGLAAVPAPLLPQELPKDSNSTTASAGSAAVSSDDGERWYICDYDTCGQKFKYQSRLELHRSVHSKERRFACELCGASFKQSCNLSTHRKKKHFLKGSKGGLVQQRF